MIVVDKVTTDVKRLLKVLRQEFESGYPQEARTGKNENYPWIAVLEDDGFPPKGMTSPYEYFLGKENGGIPEEKELFFDFIHVPEFWEIRAEGASGAVYDMGRKKADIYFAKPPEKRNVQRVEWRMENGRTYKIDYYNKYGMHYASAFMGSDGQADSKVYYSGRHQEIIVEQSRNDTVTLLHEGRIQALFTSYSDFLSYYLERIAEEVGSGKHILWLQDNGLMPPGMLETESGKVWERVLFRYQEPLEQYRSAGGVNGMRFYGVPEPYPVNRARGEAMVLTASDQLEGIEYLINELPEITFHIAANTQVSEKLINLASGENVKVYPQISPQDLERLWGQCDFYLDINHYREIFDAIAQAHRRNLVILGFEGTLHNRELTAEEGVFSGQDYEGMAQALEDLAGYPGAVQELLKHQQEKKRQAWEDLRCRFQGARGQREERL